MKKLLVLLIGFVSMNVHAQDAAVLAGTYYLEGAAEGSKSGFYLDKNQTFKFFYTQSRVDRYGSGRWETDKNTIVLNGRIAPLRVYKLYSSRRTNDNFISIRFTDDNTDLVKNIECILFTARGRQKLFTNAEGLVKFNKQEIDSVQITAPEFPDHRFTFIPNNKAQNSFEFGFEKSIYEVYFDNFVLLNVDNSLLVGKHPILRGTQHRYIKDEYTIE